MSGGEYRNKLKGQAATLLREIKEAEDELSALDPEVVYWQRRALQVRSVRKRLSGYLRNNTIFSRFDFSHYLKSLASQLPSWCHDAVPHQLRSGIPRHTGTLDVLDWLINRSKLSNGDVPLLSVLARLSRELDDSVLRSELDAYRQQIAAALGGLDHRIGHLIRSSPR